MPGPLPKKARQRQRSNTPTLGLVVAGGDSGGIPLPAPDREWLVVTKNDWTELWKSSLAEAYNQTTDVPGVHRLFGLRDDRERYRRAVRKEPLVLGSKDQPVANPLAKFIGPLDTEIRQLEDRYGLNPASRLKLGITLGAAARSLDDLTRGLYGDQDEPEAEGVDPRLATIETRAR